MIPFSSDLLGRDVIFTIAGQRLTGRVVHIPVDTRARMVKVLFEGDDQARTVEIQHMVLAPFTVPKYTSTYQVLALRRAEIREKFF